MIIAKLSVIDKKIMCAIETMTGLTVADVNIRIAGVVMGN